MRHANSSTKKLFLLAFTALLFVGATATDVQAQVTRKAMKIAARCEKGIQRANKRLLKLEARHAVACESDPDSRKCRKLTKQVRNAALELGTQRASRPCQRACGETLPLFKTDNARNLACAASSEVYPSLNPYDLNGDKCVDESDLSAMREQSRCKKNCSGDLNGDGRVTKQDFNILRKHFDPSCNLTKNTPTPTPTATSTPTKTPIVTPTPKVTATPVVTPTPLPVLEACAGYEAEGIFPVSNYDRALLCPPAHARVIYVSTDGSDDNDGLSSSKPIRTLEKAMSLIGDQPSGDWIVLRRGDTWFGERFGVLRARETRGHAGISADQPLVFSAYGEGIQRPRVVGNGQSVFQIWGHPTRPDFGYVTVSGLHLKTAPGTGGSGFRLLSGARDIVLEDNVVEGFKDNIIIQGGDDPAEHFHRVLLVGNLVLDSASNPGPGGHSSGIFVTRAEGVVLEGNLFDHNGWAGSRDTGLDPSLIVGCTDTNDDGAPVVFNPTTGYIDACPPGDEPIYAGTEKATIFNHNLYLQGESYPAVVRENVITRASSHGIQARSGGWLEGNVFARNPLNAFVAGNAIDPIFTSTMRYNVVLEGLDINADTPRGFGLSHNNAYDSLIEQNIIANMHPSATQNNNIALEFLCQNAPSATAFVGQFNCSSRAERNIVYHWTDVTGRGNAMSFALTDAVVPYGPITVSRNIIEKLGAPGSGHLVSIKKNLDSIVDAGDRLKFASNHYTHARVFDSGSHGGRFETGLEGSAIYFSTWRSDYEPTATASSSIAFPDSCRTLATYFDDVILGNVDNDNCSIMHDDELFDAFLNYMREHKNRLAPDERLNATAINNYIREGFGEREVELQ